MHTDVSYHYEIRIEESLAERCCVWFGDLDVRRAEADDARTGACTIISGRLPDQPALFSILARIRDLNLTLISVDRRRYGPDV